MEKSTKANPCQLILDQLAKTGEAERAQAFDELLQASKAKGFAREFAAALMAHPSKSVLLQRIVQWLSTQEPSKEIRAALLMACDGRQLESLAQRLVDLGEQQNFDAKEEFAAALLAMGSHELMAQAIDFLAGGTSLLSNVKWLDWLYQLATTVDGKTKSKTWLALAGLWRHAAGRLTPQQQAHIMQLALTTKIDSPVDAKCLVFFVEGLRRAHRLLQNTPHGFDLTGEQWKTLFLFLVDNQQVQALNQLLSCGPGEMLPPNLAAVVIGGMQERSDWTEEPLSPRGEPTSPRGEPPLSPRQALASPRQAASAARQVLGAARRSIVKRRSVPAEILPSLFDKLIDIQGVFTRIAVALWVHREHDLLLVLLDRLQLLCASSRAARQESVTLVISLADLQIDIENYWQAQLQAKLCLFVEAALERPQQTEVAPHVVRMVWRRGAATESQCALLMVWLSPADVDLQLQGMCCTLAFVKPEDWPHAFDWNSVLACARKARRRDRFVEVVLMSIGEPLREPPENVLAEALEWAEGPGQFGAKFSTLWADTIESRHPKSYDAILTKFITQDDVNRGIDFLIQLAINDPGQWTARRDMLGQLLQRGNACLTLITLASELYMGRHGAMALWTTLIAWTEHVSGPDQQFARVAISLPLVHASRTPPASRWCAVLPPERWFPDLKPLIDLHDSGLWLACLSLIKGAQPALAAIFQAVFVKALLAMAKNRYRLNFADESAVAKAQKGLKEQFPTIDWNCVLFSGADAQQRELVAQFCTEPMIGSIVGGWVTSLGELSYQLVIHKGIDKAALHAHLLPVLMAGQGAAAVAQAGGDIAPEQVVKVFGRKGAAAPSRCDILEGFRVPGVEPFAFSDELDHHLMALLDLAGKAKLDADCIAVFGAAHRTLKKSITSPFFRDSYDNFWYASIDLLDKGDMASLLLMQQLALVPPDAQDWAAFMLAALAGPCMVVTVRDETGGLMAFLGCTLVKVDAGAHGPAHMALVCEKFFAYPGLDFSSPDSPAAISLAPELLVALQRLADKLKVDRILVSTDCFFAPGASPVIQVAGLPLASSDAWHALVAPPGHAGVNPIVTFNVREQAMEPRQ